MRLVSHGVCFVSLGSVLVFVEKQENADVLFKDLLRRSYPCLSLHGGNVTRFPRLGFGLSLD